MHSLRLTLNILKQIFFCCAGSWSVETKLLTTFYFEDKKTSIVILIGSTEIEISDHLIWLQNFSSTLFYPLSFKQFLTLAVLVNTPLVIFCDLHTYLIKYLHSIVLCR